MYFQELPQHLYQYPWINMKEREIENQHYFCLTLYLWQVVCKYQYYPQAVEDHAKEWNHQFVPSISYKNVVQMKKFENYNVKVLIPHESSH